MQKKKLVVKLGTSTLTQNSSRIKRGKMEDIAQQLLELQATYDILLVSSGAVAAARQTIVLQGGNRDDIAYKQALAAIGQPFLMSRYQEVFGDFNLKVAQCLLSYNDVQDAQSIENILNTFQILWQNNFIPIINENDTVATEEIRFGDNDKLAALVAILVKADLLILASDMDGLYNRDPKLYPDAKLITLVNETTLGGSPQQGGSHLSETAQNSGEPPLQGDPPSVPAQGTGGIQSKLIAAELCMQHQIEMWIVNGQQENFILKAMQNEILFTRFQ